MKTLVYIYTGFLGSGKTSLVKHQLKSGEYTKQRTVVIQCEMGEEELQEDIIPSSNFLVKRITKDETLNAEVINEILKEYQPQRIIIEQNGMSGLNDLLDIFNEKHIRKTCLIKNVVNVIDCSSFDMLMSIVGANLIEQAASSNLVVLNFAHKISKDKLGDLKRKIKTLNKSVEILSIGTPQNYSQYFDNNTSKKHKSSWVKKAIRSIFIGSFLLMAYLLIQILTSKDFNVANIDFSKLQVINTIFISILMEAFPFLLIGVLVSSIIQIFTSRDMIIKYFPRNKVTSLFAAVFGGLLLPVCDCAIVPVTSRLVKKGVPIYAAVTFMLSAPIVNPIVIVSTLYAFPGQPLIAFARVYLGIIIAVATGLAFLLFPEDEAKLVGNWDSLQCGCSYCDSSGQKSGTIEKVVAVFKHAGEEFFDVGRFLVVGAFLTSIFQVSISRALLDKIGNSGVSSLLIMMVAAFILSVCSSSDAFIARSFSNQFSMGSVMGFMVLGPMLDIKNVLMLLGRFNKRFVAKFLTIICIIAFVVLYIYKSTMF